MWRTRKLSKAERWSSLTLDDKVSMLHEVIIGKEKQAVVAKRYRRT